MRKLLRYARLLWVLPLMASASLLAQTASISPVIIVEIQTGSSVSASEEFIELANVSETDVDMSSWRVEYFPASAANFNSPSRSVVLHGILTPGDHYLLASSSYLEDISNDSFGATLAKSGGHIRLVSFNNETGAIQDLVGWGTALHPAGSSAPAPADGQSLERKIDTVTSDFVNTSDNSNDFQVGVPNPEGYVPPPPEENTDPITSPTPTDPSPQDPPTPIDSDPIETPDPVDALIAPYITELLPNPAPPQTDSDYEFVELYNPNSIELDLSGYKLQSGNTYNHSYTFDSQTILPLSYGVFYVSDTKLTLANESGKARLINPSGEVISETSLYEKAGDGQSWMWDGVTWQWSTASTPGQPNVLVASLATKTAKTGTTTKKAATKKKTATKKTKAASTKKGKKAAAVNSVSEIPGSTEAAVQPLHPAILAGVGGLALLYAGYEYRHDMANFFHKLRRYRKLGVKNRPSTQRR